jgi:hypothetical protein
MKGYAIKVIFSSGDKGYFERVTMRKGEKLIVIKELGTNDMKVFNSKRDVLNRVRDLQRQFGASADFEVIYSYGREVQKLR